MKKDVGFPASFFIYITYVLKLFSYLISKYI